MSYVKLFKNIMPTLLCKSILFIFALALLTACGSQKTIVHGLDEREANDIIVFLAKKGIEALKVQNVGSGSGAAQTVILWDITVSPEKAVEATAALNEGGYPKRPGQNLLTIFPKSGLVPSEMEEKIRYQAGLAEQIASTIRKIDGVLDADVQLSIPEEDPLNPTAKREHVSASVYVKHTGILDDPNSQLIPKIKRFVSSSIQGLDYDNVTVIPDRARFSETPFTRPTGHTEDMEYVSIWGIDLSKNSAFLFQVIFFSFTILLLLLLISFFWLIWKFFPIIKQVGSLKDLISIHPIHPEHLNEKKKTEEENTEKKEEDKENDENEPTPPENKSEGPKT